MSGSQAKLLPWLLAAAIVAAPPAAFGFSWSCLWGSCPANKKKQVFDQSTKLLLLQLAGNPALMNIEYLKYTIGRPENEQFQHGAERRYFWYDANHQLKYELDESEAAPGMVTQATMLVNLAGTGLTFDKLHKELAKFNNGSSRPDGQPGSFDGGSWSSTNSQSGSADTQSGGFNYSRSSGKPPGRSNNVPPIPSRCFYDYSGRPCELFSFSPNTYISFACPQNTFCLSEARIVYRGQPLPPPSESEMQLAAQALSERARLAGLADAKVYDKTKPGKKRKPSKDKNAVADAELMPLLIARVRSQPLDPEAHLMLAQALKRQAHLNEAISEYKIALALSGDNQAVRDQTLLGLGQMMILPDDVPAPRRTIEIVDHGQHMRAVGTEAAAEESP